MADALPHTFFFYKQIDPPENLMSKLVAGETIEYCVKTYRDAAVFTDRRILIADRQGLTGKKVEYFTIPYKHIITYGFETAGTLDFDCEIKLNMAGGYKIEIKLDKSGEMGEILKQVYHLITKHVIG